MLALLVATASFYGNERPIHFPRWLGRHRYRTLTMWPAAVSSIVLAVAGGSTASPSAAAGATNASLSPTAAVRAGEANASRVVRQLAQQSGASWIDVQSWFCAGGRCPSLINGIVPCWNKRHMTKTYSRYLAPTLAPLLHLNG